MFTEIQLQNFRGLKQSKRLNLAPMTIFIGDEASGKSTVGQFLTLLKQTVHTADSSVVFFPGNQETSINLGTQSSLYYKNDLQNPIEFTYQFTLPEYFSISDIDTDNPRNGLQFRCGEHIQFSCTIQSDAQKYPFVQRMKYDLFDQKNKALSISTERMIIEGKNAQAVQYPITTEGYTLRNRTGRPWLQQPPKHFYGFSEEIQTYYKNAEGFMQLSQAHEDQLKNIYYVGTERRDTDRLHIWSGLHRFDVGTHASQTIPALLGAKHREVSLGQRRRNQPLVEVLESLLQKLELVHSFTLSAIESIEHAYEVRIQNSKSKIEVNLHEAGQAIQQVLPILVQCLCAPHNSVIVLDGIDAHLHPRTQALLADVLVDILHSKEAGEDRNIQLIVSTQSEAFVTRLQTLVASATTAIDNIQLYHTENSKKGIQIRPIALIEEQQRTNLRPFFTIMEEAQPVVERLLLREERGLVRPEAPQVVEQPKARRGRPRKNPVETSEANTPKRGRGRPRKNPVVAIDPNQPKRGRGRPRKNPVVAIDPNQPKRGRGRPRKNPVVAIDPNQPKRGRGRPPGSKNKRNLPISSEITQSLTHPKAKRSDNPSATRLKSRHITDTSSDIG